MTNKAYDHCHRLYFYDNPLKNSIAYTNLFIFSGLLLAKGIQSQTA